MRIITDAVLRDFHEMLQMEEKSDGTIEKYLRDVRSFRTFAGERNITADLVKTYKKEIMAKYSYSTVNAKLASLNRLFRYLQWYDCIVKRIRIQSSPFRNPERELHRSEYERLVSTAEHRGDVQLSLLLQTLASTGIRISELPAITVEGITNRRAVITLKGKTREILLPKKLCTKLKWYAQRRGITTGSVFITRSGKHLDRSNIAHKMKTLCEEARVDPRKVFPHNFRHLFACLFFQSTKDMPRLADILGHSNINTTRIYTAVSGNEQLKQIDKLKLVI